MTNESQRLLLEFDKEFRVGTHKDREGKTIYQTFTECDGTQDDCQTSVKDIKAFILKAYQKGYDKGFEERALPRTYGGQLVTSEKVINDLAIKDAYQQGVLDSLGKLPKEQDLTEDLEGTWNQAIKESEASIKSLIE